MLTKAEGICDTKTKKRERKKKCKKWWERHHWRGWSGEQIINAHIKQVAELGEGKFAINNIFFPIHPFKTQSEFFKSNSNIFFCASYDVCDDKVSVVIKRNINLGLLFVGNRLYESQ